ncbi:hypothetical protein ACFL6U_27845 [Planctomycetota bacterium]
MQNANKEENEVNWPERRQVFPVIMPPIEDAQFLRMDNNHEHKD